MAQAFGLPCCFPLGEFFGSHPALYLQVLRRGLQVLADGHDIAADGDEVVQNALDLGRLFAQTEHDAGLGDEVLLFGDLQEIERAGILGLRADGAIEAGHSFQVVVEDFRAFIENQLQGFPLAAEVGDEDLDGGAGGDCLRTWRMVSAQTAAPPSGSSSRLTLVRTTWCSFMIRTASPTRWGSSRSSVSGRPVAILQNPHERVQTLPRIINVAVPWAQHSPMFGHLADWQTVCRRWPLTRSTRREYSAPWGIFILSQLGLRCWGAVSAGAGPEGQPPALLITRSLKDTFIELTNRRGEGLIQQSPTRTGWEGLSQPVTLVLSNDGRRLFLGGFVFFGFLYVFLLRFVTFTHCGAPFGGTGLLGSDLT